MAALDPNQQEPDSSEASSDVASSDEPEKPAARPISLDALKGAFAKMLGGGEKLAGETDDEELQSAKEQQVLSEVDSQDDLNRETVPEPEDEAPVTPESILEAMLFVGTPDNRPLSSKMLASLMRGVSTSEIEQHVETLNAEYVQENAPYEIVSEAEGFRMALRESHERTRQKFYGKVRQAKLSSAAVEVLSIVAYNQPTTRDEVNKVRGASSGSLLTQLVRRQLLRIDREEIDRAEKKKRQIRYSTSDRFLRLFGLESIEDLPRSDELLGED